MNRLTELEERSIIGMLARIKAQHADMKITPQPTSVKSGVRTYQVPDGDLWDDFDVYKETNGSELFLGKHSRYLLPGTGGINTPRIFSVLTEFEPKNQKAPVVYPYLTVCIDGHTWEPSYQPSMGLIFTTRDVNASSHVFSGWYLDDRTNYRDASSLRFSYLTMCYYDTPSNSPVELKIKFTVRSTDRGKTKVKVVLDD